MESLWSLIALIPAFIAIGIVQTLDARRPEPARNRLAAFGAGALATLAVVLVWRAVGITVVDPGPDIRGIVKQAFLLAALPEELAKLGALLLIARLAAFDERVDGVVYGALIGLGFGALENTLYLYDTEDWTPFLERFVIRSFASMPMHGLLVAMMGATLARRRFDGRGLPLPAMLAVAIAAHGLYNTALFASLHVEGSGKWLLLFVPFGIVGGLWAAVRVMLVAALAADDREEMRTGRTTPGATASGAASDGGAELFKSNALVLFALPVVLLLTFVLVTGDLRFGIFATALTLALATALLQVWSPPRSANTDLAGVLPCPACGSLQTAPCERVLADGSEERVMQCGACDAEFGGDLGPEVIREPGSGSAAP